MICRIKNIVYWVCFILMIVSMACSQSNMSDASEEYAYTEDSEDAEEGYDEEQQESDDANYGLSGNALSKENLEAFEERAIQKLMDFIDYGQIIANEEYEYSFREEAVSQAIILFSSENSLISSNLIVNDSNLRWTVEELLKVIKISPETIYLDKISEIEVVKGLSEVNAGLYKGLLRAKTQSYRDVPFVDCVIVLKKTTKQFGSEKQEIWEVKLDGIYNTSDVDP